MTIIDRGCYERGCACFDDRIDKDGVEVAMTAPKMLKRQMPMIQEIESILDFYGYTKGTPEWKEIFDYQINFYRKFVGETK